MLTATTLKSYTAKDLAQMARKRGISGWHTMKKDQLVKAIVRVATKTNGQAVRGKTGANNAPAPKTAAGKTAAGKTVAAKGAPVRAAVANGTASVRSATLVRPAATDARSKTQGANGKLKSSASKSTHGTTNRLVVPAGGTAKSNKKAPPAPSVKSEPSRTNGVSPSAGNGTSKTPVAKNGTHTAMSNGFRPAIEPVRSAGAAVKRTGANAGPVVPPAKPKSKGVIRRIQQVHQAREAKMDLATISFRNGDAGSVPTEDRIVLLVRDPYWLQAHWELTSRCVERAQAALKERWHSARPVLRLLSISNNNVSNNPECVVRVIEIHGAIHNWFIDVLDPPSSYRVEIGYLAADDHFYGLARSNPVTTPRPGSADMLETNWVDLIDNPEKIFALSGGYDENSTSGELQSLFEDRLRRPMGSPMVTRFGNGAEAALNRDREMQFTIDAEMVVYGVTSPHAYVTMSGEPVKLREDGTFVARVSLPDRRQVIPIVASSGDGVEERTIVLAVEKNTKVMEPKMREPGE